MIPSAALNPPARLGCVRCVLHLREDLLLCETPKIEMLELLADAGEVHMRVGKTRHSDAGDIYATGGWRREAVDLGTGPDGHNAAIRHGESVHSWT